MWKDSHRQKILFHGTSSPLWYFELARVGRTNLASIQPTSARWLAHINRQYVKLTGSICWQSWPWELLLCRTRCFFCTCGWKYS